MLMHSQARCACEAHGCPTLSCSCAATPAWVVMQCCSSNSSIGVQCAGSYTNPSSTLIPAQTCNSTDGTCGCTARQFAWDRQSQPGVVGCNLFASRMVQKLPMRRNGVGVGGVRSRGRGSQQPPDVFLGLQPPRLQTFKLACFPTASSIRDVRQDLHRQDHPVLRGGLHGWQDLLQRPAVCVQWRAVRLRQLPR